jgi:hypothetical protein
MDDVKYVFLTFNEDSDAIWVEGFSSLDKMWGYVQCFRNRVLGSDGLTKVLGAIRKDVWCAMAPRLGDSLVDYWGEFPFPEDSLHPSMCASDVRDLCDNWDKRVAEKQKPVPQNDLYRCPYCGATQVSFRDFDWHGATMWKDMHCGACEKTYRDYYLLDSRTIDNSGDHISMVPEKPVLMLGTKVYMNPVVLRESSFFHSEWGEVVSVGSGSDDVTRYTVHFPTNGTSYVFSASQLLAV